MFSALFEVCPRSDQRDAYLIYAKMLRPELEQIDGFVDNIRYRSLTREGWILSLSRRHWSAGARRHAITRFRKGAALMSSPTITCASGK
jgi:hypothetical protein